MATRFQQQVTQAQNTKRSAEGARAEAQQARAGIPTPNADRLIAQGDQQLTAGNDLLARGHPAEATGQYAAANASFNSATQDAERERAALAATAAATAAAQQAAAAAAQQAAIARQRAAAAAQEAAARSAAQKAAAAAAVQAALNAKAAAVAANTQALKTIAAQPPPPTPAPVPIGKPSPEPASSRPSPAGSPTVKPSKPPAAKPSKPAPGHTPRPHGPTITPTAQAASLSPAALEAYRKAKAAGVLRELWLHAERQQETGYPNGRYDSNVPHVYGAYSWDQLSGWENMARDAGYGRYASSPPADAPDSVQDAVAWHFMGPYVENGNLAAAAELWNGGVPYPVPNPVLGSTAVYADEVIAKFETLVAQLPASGTQPQHGHPPSHGPGSGPQVTTPPSGVSSGAWNGNPEGVQLQAAYQNLHDTLSTWNPGFRHQLQLLASRPIGG